MYLYLLVSKVRSTTHSVNTSFGHIYDHLPLQPSIVSLYKLSTDKIITVLNTSDAKHFISHFFHLFNNLSINFN